MLKSAPLIPVTPASPIQGSFAPSHAVRAPIPHGPTDVVGSTTSTGKRARTPEPESVSSPTPLRRGTSVTLPAASVAVAVSAIARALVVAANLSSAVRLPYRSRATTRKTTVSRERSVRLPTTGVSPRSTTSASGGPGATRTSTVRARGRVGHRHDRRRRRARRRDGPGPGRGDGARQSGAQALVDGGEHRVVRAGGPQLGAVVRGGLERDAIAAHQGRYLRLRERPPGEHPHQLGLAQRLRALGAGRLDGKHPQRHEQQDSERGHGRGQPERSKSASTASTSAASRPSGVASVVSSDPEPPPGAASV